MGAYPRTIATVMTVTGLLCASALVGYALGRPHQLSTELMLDSSVSIKTISHVITDRYGDSVWEPAFGSGFLVSSTPCEVWTNHHVIKDAALIRVTPRGAEVGTGVPAQVVYTTPHPDIAVLRLESCEGVSVAALADSDRIRVGMEAYAVGNPLGNNPDSISRGIVSHTARHVGTNTYLQTDASINPGNSGGALFDRQGQVIGMNVSLVSRKNSGGHTGIGYAIPVNQLKTAVAQLRARTPGWGTAGISDIASNLNAAEAAVFKVPNMQTAIILTATPTHESNAEHLNARDVIYQVDGQPVNDVEHLRRIFAGHEPGTEVAVDLIRNGDQLRATLKLKNGYQRQAPPGPQPYDGLLGMTLEMWGDLGGDTARFTSPVITQVQSLGPAHLAEISSSQHSMGISGGKLVEFLLDVKTVTGVVLDGTYHPATDVAAIHRFAANAHARNVPLLLEIEHWARQNPRNARTELVHRKTAFFKIEPVPGLAEVSPAGEESDLEAVSVDLPQPSQRIDQRLPKKT